MLALASKGIILEIWFEREKLTPDENGYLGEFSKGDFQLKYTLPEKEPKPICFIADGKKNVVSMSRAIKTIPVTRDSNNTFTTMPASNNIRFAIFGPTGKSEIWKIAILSQGGVFFLAEQKTHEAQWSRDENNEAVCLDSYFANRPQLIELLKPVMEREQLPPVSEYSPPPQIKANGLPKGQGRVILWDLPGQWGLITYGDKGTVAQVHWRELPLNLNGVLRKLEVGQIVSYIGIRETPQNSRSKTVNLRATGITPL